MIEVTRSSMGNFLVLAERVGFEPTVGLHLRLISSQVHSTTLPPLRLKLNYSQPSELAGIGIDPNDGCLYNVSTLKDIHYSNPRTSS